MKPKRLIVVRFRQDRGKWEADYRTPPGSVPPRVRRLFDSEEAALRYAAQVAPRLDAAAPPVRDAAMTLGAAFDRYLELRARRPSIVEDRRTARRLLAAFGEGTRLRDLTASKIAAYKAERLAAGRRDAAGQPLSAAAINRPLAMLRHLLRLAHEEWEVLQVVPRIRLEKEPQGRLRWLEAAEEVRLLKACRRLEDGWLLAIVVVALETGLRRGELLGLTWERVDFGRGVIRLEITKSGRRPEVPMRQTVYDVLSGLPGGRTGRLRPDIDRYRLRRAWEAAVEAAGLEDFRFHDLRHTFASRFVMRGGGLPALQQILGHSTLAMTMRYAHLAPGHLRAEMIKTEAVLEPNVGTNAPLAARDVAEPRGMSGEPWWDRTTDPLIKSQVLYQLS
jgi:integrase